MLGSIIVLGLISYLVLRLYRNAEALWDFVLITLFGIALFFVLYVIFPGLYLNLARDFDNAQQKCFGVEVRAGKCLGAVQSRY